MSDDDEVKTGQVLVFRNGAGQPVVVPDDVATAAERAYRVFKARRRGDSWEQIAEDEHYPSGQAAKYDYDRYMEEARSLVVENSAKEALSLEVNRLDFLQTRLWGAAEAGSIAAIKEIRGIIMDRAKLVSVVSEIKEADTDETGRTVVVMQTERETYLERLRRVAGDATGPTADDGETLTPAQGATVIKNDPTKE
jgi:hypothetical protein